MAATVRSNSHLAKPRPEPPRTTFVGIRNVSVQYPVAFKEVYKAADEGLLRVVVFEGRTTMRKLFRAEVEQWLQATGRI